MTDAAPAATSSLSGAHQQSVLTFRMEGGLKSMDDDVSVPRSDLLGVSGFSMDWSPPLLPNIMLGKEAGVFQRAAKALRAPWKGNRKYLLQIE